MAWEKEDNKENYIDMFHYNSFIRNEILFPKNKD